MQWPLSVIDTHKDKVKVTHNLIFSPLIFVFVLFVTQTVQKYRFVEGFMCGLVERR